MIGARALTALASRRTRSRIAARALDVCARSVYRDCRAREGAGGSFPAPGPAHSALTAASVARVARAAVSFRSARFRWYCAAGTRYAPAGEQIARGKSVHPCSRSSWPGSRLTALTSPTSSASRARCPSAPAQTPRHGSTVRELHNRGALPSALLALASRWRESRLSTDFPLPLDDSNFNGWAARTGASCRAHVLH